MSKKVIFATVTIFLVATVFISGCITDKDKENKVNESGTIKSGIIPMTNLPSGFVFVAKHDTYVDIGNSSKKTEEGIYKTDQGEDVYIQVFEDESPEELLNEYKSQYKDISYEPFSDILFNGHKATKVTFYSTSNGEPVPKYNVIWTNKNVMIKVGPSIYAQKVINLAIATNN